MPQQRASINTVHTMLTEQRQTLNDFKQDFDEFREEMPENYAPRRETDKAFADINARTNDHEARLRIIESKIPNVEFSAFKDTREVREKAQTETAQARFAFDERTTSMLFGAVIMLVGYLIYFLLSHVPLH